MLFFPYTVNNENLLVPTNAHNVWLLHVSAGRLIALSMATSRNI